MSIPDDIMDQIRMEWYNDDFYADAARDAATVYDNKKARKRNSRRLRYSLKAHSR